MRKLISKSTAKLTKKRNTGKAASAIREASSEAASYIKELSYRNSALQAINIIADKLYQSFDIQTIAREAVESVVRYSNASRAVVYEFDEKNKLLRNLYSQGFSAHTVKAGSTLPLKHSLSGLAIKRRQVVSSFDLASEEQTVPAVKKALLDDGLNVGICIPLLFQNKVFGVMNLIFNAHDRDAFEEYEKDVFLSIGKTVGLALANARHVDRIKEEMAERKKAEEAMRESEKKFHDIFNNVTEGIFQTSLEGKVLTANPALAQILGYDSPEELISRINSVGTDLYVQAERRKAFLGLMSKIGFVEDFEYKAYRKDRRVIDVSVKVHVIKNENGQPVFFEGVLRDVTELKKYQQHMEDLVQERTAELTTANEMLKKEIAERKKAEQALRESENKYRSIFNNITEGIYQTTAEGKILTCNPALARILGYTSPEELMSGIKNIGTDLFIHPERRKEFLDLISKQGFVKDFEYKAYRKDRSIINVTINTYIVRDENNEPLYFEGVLKDITELKSHQEHLQDLVRERTNELTRVNESLQREITERERIEKALRQSEIKYRSIFNNTTEGIFQTTAEGKVITCSPALASILGYDSPDEVMTGIKNLGRDLYVSEERRREFLNLMGKYGFVRDFEYKAYRRDRKIIDVTINCHSVVDENNDLLYFEGVLRDITELKKYREQMEELVRARSAELAGSSQTMQKESADCKKEVDELQKLNRELEQKLSEKNKEIDALIYTVSHDLRAPLRSVDGFSRILAEDFSTELSPDALHYLQLVRSNTLVMGKLFADLLQYSRIGRQVLNKQEVQPEKIIQQVLFDLKSMQEGRQIKITVNELPSCQADPTLLKVVFTNLISNALKFTSKKESAEIEIGCLNKDGENIYFIKDNGVGFDMKYVDKMFGVFQRLHRPDEFEGVGCGSAIVKRIITMHNGRIWVEAELNKGATFFFTLGK